MKARKPIMWTMLRGILEAAKLAWSLFQRAPDPEPIPTPVDPKKAKDLLDPKE